MDFAAAIRVLRGLLPLEEGSSGIDGQPGHVSHADLDIFCAEGLQACGVSFWAACTDVNIDIRALSRLGGPLWVQALKEGNEYSFDG